MLGVVPQKIALYTNLSARQNLEFFGRMYGLAGVELHQAVDDVLEFIDLTDRQKDRIDTFSGGKILMHFSLGMIEFAIIFKMGVLLRVNFGCDSLDKSIEFE